MKTLILCIILAIILIHSIYYFKLDMFNILKPINIRKSGKEQYKITNHIDFLNQSINELKTLNECIHNGKIDTAFS